MRNTQHSWVMGEVHLWRIDLDTDQSLTALRATLSSEECQRAQRFRSPDLSRRWTVARGALRCILASYCESQPRSLVLHAESGGKPKLTLPASTISFNLSHSDGLALLAIAENRRIGVDVEIVHPLNEVADLSRRFLAPVEFRQILALPPEQQAAAFFTCWTRKEAYLKAIGLGLSVPLDRFEVTLGVDQFPRFISVDSIEPGQWNLIDVSEPGVAAALAVEGHMPVLRCLRFDHAPRHSCLALDPSISQWVHSHRARGDS